MYADPGQTVRSLANMVRPPLRIPVCEASSRWARVKTSGHGMTGWDMSTTPYMVEPMNLLSSRHYEVVVFAGPARTGKTQALVDGFYTYMVKCDQSDMQIVQTTETAAKDFSKLRISRALRSSPELKSEFSTRKTDDNVYDKWLKSGAMLKISWPSISQLSGRDMKFMALTDYDRMPLDLDKEGSVFVQAKKRTQTFMSRGMVMAESSPGYETEDPTWKPATKHEAPPTKGILGLYNLGDRRRMYWQCPHCGEWFMLQPGPEGFSFQHERDLFGITVSEVLRDVKAVCTANGCEIEEKYKHQLNQSAIWVPDGCAIERDGKAFVVTGQAPKTKIASFWMHGVAAAFQSWGSLIGDYLAAMRSYEVSGDEEPLKAQCGLNFGGVYIPQRLAEPDERDQIEKRAEPIERYSIPPGVRMLAASVDVQGGKRKRFVVQVVGIGINKEKWLIDRYDIDKTAAGEPINPAKYVEHWDEITSRVINGTYSIGENRELRIFRVVVDTGGEDGVQDRAYDWWRALKKSGLSKRVMLIKGKGQDAKTSRTAPKVKLSYPDSSNRSDRKSNARGDVPVYMLNTDKIKDAVANDLARDIPGPGYIHFPAWLQSWFYAELRAERRDDNGHWAKHTARNEAWDLLVYFYALIFAIELEIGEINWDNPPKWAAPLDGNSEIVSREERVALKAMQINYQTTRGRRVRSKGIR